MSVNKVCIFCASSQKVPEVYFKASRECAYELVRNNVGLIYGGGAVGLMGAVADTVIEMGGEIHGVIPKFMHDRGWGNPNVKTMTIVKNMHERKQKMTEDVDAVIALPGGFGTLEELAEIITQKQLGLFTKPIIILNTNDFYRPIFELCENMVREKFIRDKHREIWITVDTPDQIMEAIAKSPVWNPSIIDIAQI